MAEGVQIENKVGPDSHNRKINCNILEYVCQVDRDDFGLIGLFSLQCKYIGLSQENPTLGINLAPIAKEGMKGSMENAGLNNTENITHAT